MDGLSFESCQISHFDLKVLGWKSDKSCELVKI